MSAWPAVNFGEVVQINPRIGTDRPALSMPVTFVPMAAVCEYTGSILSPDVRQFSDVAKGFPIFAENDVLFAKITPCMENGKAAIARNLKNQIGAGSTEFFVLRPSEQILSEFIFHFIRRPHFRAICKANFTGSAGQQRVPKSFLEKTQIPLPPLDVQRRIVGLLDRAAEIRRRADAARAKARAIIPALFLNTFGDPATNPKGWPVREVGDLTGIELRNGISPSKTGTVIGNVLMLSAITRGTFDPSARKESTFAASLAIEQTVSRSLFLICRGNGNRQLVGKGAYPTVDMPGVAFPDTMIALRTVGTEVAPAYLSSVWASGHIRTQIDAAAKTTNGTFKISQGSILRFSFPLPPLALQTAFAEQVHRLESLAHNLDAAAAKAAVMAASLSAEVFG